MKSAQRLVVVVLLFMPGKMLFAHCDSMNGPVVSAAKRALETGVVDEVLAWVRVEDEPAIREAFRQTLAVRGLGSEAQVLADRYFFETLVRIHREGEGEPYTGLKEDDTAIHPGIEAADRALTDGSAKGLLDKTTLSIRDELQSLFDEAMKKKSHREHSISDGREYVKAYVRFIHTVEGVFTAVQPSHKSAEGPGHAH